MKPFRYRLQLLMEMREKARDTALESYAKAMQSRLAQQNVSEALENRVNGISRQIQDLGQQSFPASMHSIYYGSMEETKQRLKQSNALLTERCSVEEERRTKYLATKSRFDVLEKLRDRKREEHISHEFKEEEKMLEDFANSRCSFPQNLTQE